MLAAAGSAVGLGNVWRFPYVMGEHGGGAFLVAYLLSIAFIGLPIMMAELLIGRRTRRSPFNALCELARKQGASRLWGTVGLMAVLAGLVALALYSVIAGWALAYAVRTAGGVFAGVTAAGARSIFADLISDPENMLGWHTVFMVMTSVVVARGVRAGLEQAVKLLVPSLFLILLLLMGYAGWGGGLEAAVWYLFTPDFEAITADGVLLAMGHAFFTLSLGLGAIMIYGAYLPAEVSIAGASIKVALLDTLMAIMAGLVVFPILFANGLSSGEGPGLIFQTLPVAFGQMQGGGVFGTLFFILLLLVAWSSSISLMEPAVAWLTEHRRCGRGSAAIVVGTLVWLLGIAVLMSFGNWSFEFNFGGDIRNHGLFDILDISTSGFLVPLGAVVLALLVGHLLPLELLVAELGGRRGFGFRLWYFLIRYMAPAGVFLVFLDAIGVI